MYLSTKDHTKFICSNFCLRSRSIRVRIVTDRTTKEMSFSVEKYNNKATFMDKLNHKDVIEVLLKTTDMNAAFEYGKSITGEREEYNYV